jgi:hypothetical protein
MIGPHFAVSDLRSAASSIGVEVTTVMAISSSLCLTIGCASAERVSSRTFLTISAGALAGRYSPNPSDTSNPATPDSATVGIFGANGERTADVTASPRSTPLWTWANAEGNVANITSTGGIIVFLCTNLGNSPAGTPACPNPSGTVTGTITPANIIGPLSQGIAAGNFAGLVTALTSMTAYGNIHTTNFPAGEIRGNIKLFGP